MKVKCTRDNTVFVAVPKPYPLENHQSKHYCKTGDVVINCPKCGRGYFLENDGVYRCDRDLVVISA